MADENIWLPQVPTREAFEDLFGGNLFNLSSTTAGDMPLLAGASLQVGTAIGDAEAAWTIALDWLRDFRQGTQGVAGERAREPGTGKPQPNRPSWSNWPEPDKIRHLMRKTTTHPPRHNAAPVWPRAGFGLPIIGRFQNNARDGNRLDEPGSFTLTWRATRDEEDGQDRLASPLIVKALPLAGGKFVPCALWLHRAYPAGEVILKGVRNSGARFDRLVADDDQPQFNALGRKDTLRDAFLLWLQDKYKTSVLAP